VAQDLDAMLRYSTIVMALAGIHAAPVASQTIPMPPQRPTLEQTVAAGKAEKAKPTTREPDLRTCLATLAGLGIEAEAAAQPRSSNGGCTIVEPVRIRAVRMVGSKASIALPDKPLLSCPFARTYGLWLARSGAPLLKAKLGLMLTDVRTGPGFDCRNVNRARSGKLSPHATGIAIDMDRFTFANKHVLTVGKESGKKAEALRALQNAACKDFTTVLGPGSDAAHAYHIHVDLKRHGRSGTYRICGARSGPFRRSK
jgi:hypothetical protein